MNADARRAWRPGPVTSVGGAALLDVILRFTLARDPRAHLRIFDGEVRQAYVLDPGHHNPFECRPDPWVVPPRHPRTCDGCDLLNVADEALDQASFVRSLVQGVDA